LSRAGLVAVARCSVEALKSKLQKQKRSSTRMAIVMLFH
jgi:hypothetical protein